MNRFKYRFFRLLALGILMANAVVSQSAATKIDQLLKAYVSLSQFNGTALVYWDGKIVLNRGYGFQDADTKTLSSPRSIYQIGSVTKQFTSAVILKLEAAGKLNLDDSISRFFPEISWAGKVTIRQLLTHTAGVYNYTNDGNFMKEGATRPATRKEIIALFKDHPLEFTPGTKFSYSNSGYSLLGYIIEDVTGRKYEEVIRENIFQPMDMEHAGFDFVGLKSNDKARGYFTYTEALKMPSTYVDSSVSFSAGAMYCSVDDLLKWHQGLEAGKVLTPDQQKEAYTPFLSNYGFGWLTDTVYNLSLVAHNGGIFGFLSDFTRIPSRDGCIILLSNSNTSKLESITPKILAILANHPYELPKNRVAIDMDSTLLKAYTGEYENDKGEKIEVIFKNKNLVFRRNNTNGLVLFPEKPDYFFSKAIDAQVVFSRNGRNEIDRFVFYQGGKETSARKIK